MKRYNPYDYDYKTRCYDLHYLGNFDDEYVPLEDWTPEWPKWSESPVINAISLSDVEQAIYIATHHASDNGNENDGSEIDIVPLYHDESFLLRIWGETASVYWLSPTIMDL